MLAEALGVGQRVLDEDGHAAVAVLGQHVLVACLTRSHTHRVAVVAVLAASPPGIKACIQLVGKVVEEGEFGEEVADDAVVPVLRTETLLVGHGVGRIGREVGATIAEAAALCGLEGIIDGDDRGHREHVGERTAVGVHRVGVLVGQVLADLEPFVGGIGVHTGGEAAVVGTFDDTGLVHPAEADSHVHVVRTLAIHYIIILREACLEVGFLPVGVGDVLSEVIFAPALCRPGYTRVEVGQFVVLQEVDRVHHVDLLGHARKTPVGVDVERGSTLLALLGGDEDDAVGASCTVDGCCRCVLQHLHVLDFRRVEVVHIVHDQSVDDVEGTYARERTDTTDAHVGHRTGF